ncbi:MAG TPA: cytochrome c oxidase subunit II [Tepidisphaeraceae bacterium]
MFNDSKGFELFPARASSVSGEVDALYVFLIAVTVFFTLLIFVCIVYLALKYRRKHPDEIPPDIPTNYTLEYTWTIIPFIFLVIIFVWGSRLYVRMERPPENAMEIYVMAKQWMWKMQHPQGRREINELHLPVGRPIKLIMTSQDVIHSFFVPSFRTKQDVLPGRYTTEWFTPTQIGEYHLFCAEYCGAQHSAMIGKIVVQKEADYQAWLAGSVADEPMVQAGEKLFAANSCMACHGQRGPTVAGLFGRTVRLHGQDTSKIYTRVADEDYLRDAILEPSKDIVDGFPAIMPSYKGVLSEEQIFQLIAYIKSLRNAADNQNQPVEVPK